MRLFGKKQDGQKEKKEPEPIVICPHCYLDYTVEQVLQAGSVCPSCKGKIDLSKHPRAHMRDSAT